MKYSRFDIKVHFLVKLQKQFENNVLKWLVFNFLYVLKYSVLGSSCDVFKVQNLIMCTFNSVINRN